MHTRYAISVIKSPREEHHPNMHFHRCVHVVSHVLSSNRCYVFSQIKTNNLFPSISCTSICRSVQTKRVGLIMQRVLHPSRAWTWRRMTWLLGQIEIPLLYHMWKRVRVEGSPGKPTNCCAEYYYFASMGILTCVHQIGVTHYYSHRSTNVSQCVAIHSCAML